MATPPERKTTTVLKVALSGTSELLWNKNRYWQTKLAYNYIKHIIGILKTIFTLYKYFMELYKLPKGIYSVALNKFSPITVEFLSRSHYKKKKNFFRLNCIRHTQPKLCHICL